MKPTQITIRIPPHGIRVGPNHIPIHIPDALERADSEAEAGAEAEAEADAIWREAKLLSAGTVRVLEP